MGEPGLARGPVPARRRVHAAAPRARAQLRVPEHFVQQRRRAARRPLVDGHRLAGRLHERPPPRSGGASRPRASCELGVEGIKADDGEGWYIPDERGSPTARPARSPPGATGCSYRRSMQRALDEVHPETGVLFGRPGWTGQQAVGITWGGDQPSDFWSLQDARRRHADRRGLGLLELVARRRRLPRQAADGACPKELLARWVQFGCFTPLMHAHGRFEQEAWTYDEELLEIYRAYVLLHERLVPYVRAAAATAARPGCRSSARSPSPTRTTSAAGRSPTPTATARRCGSRRCSRTGARRSTSTSRAGDWIDAYTGEEIAGGGEVDAAAPLDRIPVWVRRGALIVTYPSAHVARGLGDTPEARAPARGDAVRASPPCGRAAAGSPTGPCRPLTARRSGRIDRPERQRRVPNLSQRVFTPCPRQLDHLA